MPGKFVLVLTGGDCVGVVTTVPLEPEGCVDCVPIGIIVESLCVEKEMGVCVCERGGLVAD